MSDIRSYFGTKRTAGKSTSGVSCKGKDKKDGKTSSKKKRKMVIESDSDSEEPLPTKLRKDKLKKDKSPIKTEAVSKTTKQASKNDLKPTTSADFFGSTSSDTNNNTTKGKRKQSNSPQKCYEKASNKEESPKPTKPPSKKAKVDENNKLLPRKSSQENRRTSPRKSPRKSSSNIIEIDDNSIGPTPPPKKTEVKTSKISSKLSEMMTNAMPKDSSHNKMVNIKQRDLIKSPKKVSDKKETKKDSNDGSEGKMKDSVKDYLEKAKTKEATKKEVLVAETPPAKKSKIDTPSAQTPSTKTHADESMTTPVTEKKKSYWQYKQRDGPTALGSKELPEGAEDCLEGLTFVLTGVLDAFDRDTVVDHIKRYGGKVTTGISGKTSYVIVGRDAGQSKLEKATKHKTKQLDEDGFIELVKTRPGKSGSNKSATPVRKSSKKEGTTHKSSKDVISPVTGKTESKQRPTPNISSQASERESQKSSVSTPDIQESSQESTPSRSSSLSEQTPRSSYTPRSVLSTPHSQTSLSSQSPSVSSQTLDSEALLWVDKYKPQNMKDIVGQHGDKSNANKLMKWLKNWRENNSSNPDKPKKNYMTGKEDGSIFKAALLSGPPGVGKTTTASIVCKEIGFSFIEMNASDTRGKKALDTIIKESLSNVNVFGMMQGENNAGKNHVLIMDEVDGMAGNEDRGGMQELIQLIKKSRIPIICMCNDRNHPKVRSLANYCFDLRFYKPRVEQIKALALKISCRQGVKIPPQAMEQIVVGANQDIRQVIHNLQMWSSTKTTMSYDEAKDSAKNARKNIKKGPFDIVKTLFTHGDSSKLSIHEKSDLFFNDYSFVPLFMQENYLSVKPNDGKDIYKTLDLISQTADSIADGNLVERLIRTEQSWSLLPLQGLFSTVVPSMVMSGYLSNRIEFPQWLGKNSSRNKHDRILQELKTHLALSANCMKTDINLDYIATLKRRLSDPLVNESNDANMAAKEVIDLLDSYDLTREDWDSVMEIGKWGNEPELKIPTKVKSAFTRQYNKESHKTPYSVHQTAKKSSAKSTAADDVLVKSEDAEEVVDNEENEKQDDDVSKDAMIKVKKESTTASSKKGKSQKDEKSKQISKSTKKNTANKGKSAKGKKK